LRGLDRFAGGGGWLGQWSVCGHWFSSRARAVRQATLCTVSGHGPRVDARRDARASDAPRSRRRTRPAGRHEWFGNGESLYVVRALVGGEHVTAEDWNAIPLTTRILPCSTVPKQLSNEILVMWCAWWRRGPYEPEFGDLSRDRPGSRQNRDRIRPGTGDLAAAHVFVRGS
jgi:hypothetical protein